MGMKSVIQAVEKEIEQLNRVLHLLTGGKTKAKTPRRKEMSAAGRKKISAAQKKRWAKVKAREKIKRSTIVQ